MSRKKKGLDTHSITFRLWLYFTLFAAALILVIWVLQIYLVDSRYESMKSEEITRTATDIRTKYAESGCDLGVLRTAIKDAASSNDMTILIRDTNNLPIRDFTGKVIDDTFRTGGYTNLQENMYMLREKLADSEFDSTTLVTTESDDEGTRTLEYICTLSSGTGDTYYMYIFSPLYPVKSTLAIFRSMLKYIAILSLLLALGVSLLLSRRISKPIQEITDGAAEMGRGNYNVKFRGGIYTETKELADTLTMAENEMDKAGQYQQDLIANVSHDLRTPLTMIRSYAEMIRDISGDKPEKREKHLQVIIDESNRLSNLVNDMLSLSRLQSHRMVIMKFPFDLRNATQQILSSYEIMEQEGYIFDIHLESQPVMVDADEEKIKQVMTNLLTNAVKYCGEDKVILVNLKKSGRNKIRFSVTDHGMGIAPEELSHIWDKYYKSSTHHVRHTEGTGLGLSIVKEILNLHHAEFDVVSKPGKGSTFWFELPIMRQPRASKQAPAENDYDTIEVALDPEITQVEDQQ